MWMLVKVVIDVNMVLLEMENILVIHALKHFMMFP